MSPRSLIVLLLLVSAFVGCATTASNTTDDGRLAVTKRPVIPDVPVPAGFRMDLNHTFFNSSAAMRTGYVTYAGQAGAPVLLEFFRDNMPISGWSLVRESTSAGSYTLHFEKNSEGCEVKVTPGRFSSDFTVSFYPMPGRR